ncbi:MAG: TolC family protein, partial [Cyanobacteria bacterium J06631_6]
MKQKLMQILGASIALTFSNATIAHGEKLANNDSFSSKDFILDSLELAQSSEPNIIKPAQQSISDTTELNPNPDPLSRPTQADEVEVDPQKPITLQQAIALSLNNNRDVETARIQIEQSLAALREARAGLYPNLDLGSGLNYGDELFLDSVAEQAADRNLGTNLTDSTSANFEFNTDLTLGYDIYDGGFRGANIRSAEKELKTDELNLEVVIEQIRF